MRSSSHAKICLRFLISVFLSLITAQIHAQTFATSLGGSSIGATERGRIVENYGKLPLSFEVNQGQTDEQVKFLSRGHGYTLLLTRDTAIFALGGNPSVGSTRVSGESSGSGTKAQSKTALLRLKLLKANPVTKVSGEDELGGKVSYFIGNDPKKWRTNLPTYGRVKYKNIYPGIDLIYYGNQRHLEYDFVVAPGANPTSIQLDVRGAQHISRAKNGDLIINIDGGEVRWLKPVVYQEKEGKRRQVAGHYVVKSAHRVGFEVAEFDSRRPLVIDPALAYSTFLGGSGGDNGLGIAVDVAGNAYVTGSTKSYNFPTTPGAFQTTCGGGGCVGDAFVTKLNPSGSALVYSTFLGGFSFDGGSGIALDASGDAFVTGFTESTDFPVTAGAFQTACGGTCVENGFVTELNPSGSALVYSTYLGGSGGDQGNAIAVDGAGDAYVSGQTQSSDFPVTAGAFQTTYSGAGCGAGCGVNSFVTKLNPDGSALVYSTYLGGSVNDYGHGIALDASGDAYVTGKTQSTNFPVTAGAFQTVCNACSVVGASPVLTNAFITELNPAGSSLAYSTYLGGSGNNVGGDTANGIAVDSSGNAYVAGLTYSSNFPTTPGAFQTTCGGPCSPPPYSDGGTGFITKLNPTGSALVYSTYLHGSSQETIQGIAIDAAGNAYVTGFTDSYDFPTTPNAFQTACVPDPDGGCNGGVFMTKMNSAGSAVIYSSFLMGVGEDVFSLPIGNGIAVDAGGNAYVTGVNEDSDFPTTPGAFQTTLFSTVAGNAFVTKFSFVLLSPPSLSFANQVIGTTSASQSTTLTDGSANPVTGITVTITGTNSSDFSQTNNCGSSLAVGASCNINVTFTPTAAGSRSATVSVSDTASNSPQTAALSGTGTSTMTVTPSSLNFGFQAMGVPSTPQTVSLTNAGNVAVTITSIGISGTNSSNFAETNNCPASLAPKGSCTINVTFTPTVTGSFSASLSVTFNASGSPQMVSLTGDGPALTLSPASVTFPGEYVGTSGLPQTVTVTNTAGFAVDITSVTTTLPDFGTLNACGSTVAAGSSCAIGVFFDPTASGTRTGTLKVSDNVDGGAGTVGLSGPGQDFSLTPSSSSDTVAPGQTANYTVSVASAGGFSQTVTLSCSGAPAMSTCSVSPNSVALKGSGSVPVNVTVTTAGGSASLTVPNGISPSNTRLALLVSLSGLSGFVVLGGGRRRRFYKRQKEVIRGLVVLCVIGLGVTWSACGGGSGNGGSGGTPAGTYNVTVSGSFTSGPTTLTHNTKLTLVVQ
jgi:hypothetical protein